MSSGIPGQPHKHKAKFYLLLVTLVVGSIFILLMHNDNFKKLNLTGSAIELLNQTNTSTVSTFSQQDLLLQQLEKNSEERSVPSREVDVEVTFSSVPETSKEVYLQDLELHFANTEGRANAKVNADSLDLPNEAEVVVKVHEFTGFVTLDPTDFSLEGKAKKLEVNGLVLSSRQDLQLSLNNVQYSLLSAENFQAKKLEFSRGDGKLHVAEKLEYRLEQEGLNFQVFEGKMNVDNKDDLPTSIVGVARGIVVSGALLNLDVR